MISESDIKFYKDASDDIKIKIYHHYKTVAPIITNPLFLQSEVILSYGSSVFWRITGGRYIFSEIFIIN